MKNLISKEEKDRIDLICKQYDIKNYSINSDGTVDVIGDVELFDSGITELPIKFNNVTGLFDCARNSLTSLNGSPITVGGDFYCSYNTKLTSLVGSPVRVGNDYHCRGNILTSLEGMSKYIGGSVFCARSDFTSTYTGDEDIEIVGDFSVYTGISLPALITNNWIHIKLIMKYQRHFYIWNDDLSLNEENFKDLISEIEDGLE
jgi:hypothetical protein